MHMISEVEPRFKDTFACMRVYVRQIAQFIPTTCEGFKNKLKSLETHIHSVPGREWVLLAR